MNVSELSAGLHEQADEMDARMAPQLSQVHARVHRVRRRRMVAVGLAGAVSLAAAVVLAVVLPGGQARPEPVVPGPAVFPERIGQYGLVTAESGEPGDNRITLSLPRPSKVFAVSVACRGPQGRLDTRLVVNGTDVGGATCTPNPLALGDRVPSPSFTEKDLRVDGVAVDQKKLAISLTLVQGRFAQQPTTEASSVLAIAVYERDN